MQNHCIWSTGYSTYYILHIHMFCFILYTIYCIIHAITSTAPIFRTARPALVAYLSDAGGQGMLKMGWRKERTTSQALHSSTTTRRARGRSKIVHSTPKCLSQELCQERSAARCYHHGHRTCFCGRSSTMQPSPHLTHTFASASKELRSRNHRTKMGL